jgi:predicted PurR-regulated permease PerM
MSEETSKEGYLKGVIIWMLMVGMSTLIGLILVSVASAIIFQSLSSDLTH